MRTPLLITLLSSSVLAQPAPKTGSQPEDPSTTFFMGRVKYSKNDGNDCMNVGQALTKLVSGASTVHVGGEKRLALTEPLLFETPFLFMNGHNDFEFSDAELKNLSTYLAHGGFLFASGCCTNPDFPRAWRREMSRVFPGESVRRLNYDHPIYRASYRIERVRCLHENKEIYLEGLFHQGELVAVMCEEGLCCAFSEQNRCNAGKGIGPEDGQKLALNIAIYAMTH